MMHRCSSCGCVLPTSLARCVACGAPLSRRLVRIGAFYVFVLGAAACALPAVAVGSHACSAVACALAIAAYWTLPEFNYDD